MKKTISLLLSLLLVLSLAACVGVKTADKTADKPTGQEENTTTDTVTSAPTEAPQPTAAPTEAPFQAVLAESNKKLADVAISLAMGEMNQTLPLEARMTYDMDFFQKPLKVRANVAMSAMGEDVQGILYVVREGDATITYSSQDDGLTWQKQTNAGSIMVPQAPTETLELFSGDGVNIEKTGTEEVDGKTATVYSGTVSGKLLEDILSSTGAASEMEGVLGSDLPEEALANIGDISVTILIDQESGLPLRYTIDMGDAMGELMQAIFQAKMGGDMPEGMSIDVEAVKMDIQLSDFDSVEPFEIPEAALNTPEL